MPHCLRFFNYLTVSYSVDALRGEYHPTEIAYGGNLPSDHTPQHRIAISYESRPDTFAGYLADRCIGLTKRLKTIEAFHGQTLCRKYDLVYLTEGKVSRLCGIEESTNAERLTPTRFTWGDTIMPDNYQLPYGFAEYNTVFADMNGDGLNDIVCYQPKNDYTTADSITVFHARRTSSGRIVYAPDQKVGLVEYFNAHNVSFR